MNREELQATALLALGGFLIALGLYGTIDAWSTIQQVEAQGIIGQTFNQETFTEAVDQLKLFSLLFVGGLVAMVLGAASSINAKLEDLTA